MKRTEYTPPPTDCGPDGGCDECDVCRYLNFIEWAGSVAPPGSSIEYNPVIDAYLRERYPHAFPPSLTEINRLNAQEVG